MDLNQFSTRIHEIAIDAEEGVERTVRQTALMVDQTVVMATPVDTGRARANWIAGLGAAVTTVREAFGAQAALDQASSAIAGYDVAANPTIYISNNLPYIGSLNDGTSAQAPRDFIRRAIAAGVAMVRNARILS